MHLEGNGIPKKYINRVQDIYHEVKTNVRTCKEQQKFFQLQLPPSRLGPKSLSFCNGHRRDDSIDTNRCALVHGVC